MLFLSLICVDRRVWHEPSSAPAKESVLMNDICTAGWSPSHLTDYNPQGQEILRYNQNGRDKGTNFFACALEMLQKHLQPPDFGDRNVVKAGNVYISFLDEMKQMKSDLASFKKPS